MDKQSEVAFYYPGPMWYRSEAIKNLLLFFDAVGLLVPSYMLDRPEAMDPSLAMPLRDAGLLHLLGPESLVDAEATAALATQLADIIHSGILDDLAKSGGEFHELSMSRLGFDGDSGLARMIFEELRARGLARDSEDGVSIPMHRNVRYLVLVLLAQILRPRGVAHGMDLHPATDRPELVAALADLLSHPEAPSAAHIVSADLTTVGVDLSKVPLDEVLSFRADHRVEHHAYARDVRRLVLELGAVPADERERLLDERHRELADAAEDLRSLHRKAWRKPASWALGAAGAAWSATTGDPFGVFLSATSLAAGMGKEPRPASALSFVFSARGAFTY